ncbi:E3 SUMO-protein ligase RanBP2 isoform X2 [Scaptodrosophila lebanonensis]|uniref:E3 SUMO-protein ligase RanBP2 isoform X2 n=1 Tax=Drosophila lebanonensis TaxID=7225 RepID=A0A6J2TGT0_DROLE|nr:E3 SUMO-protein ligase RanBP2 isoform X2 [Scaptodrosophila lebanonensis]
MFTTRKEVDDHVHRMLSKLPFGSERDIKGLTVAKLYNKIGEYPKAIEYLNSYLKIKDEPLAHKLIAHCYKLLKTPDRNKALHHYQRCIQLSPRQVDVIKEACQLLLDDENSKGGVYSDEKAKYWCELATKAGLAENDLVYALNSKLALKEHKGGGGSAANNGEEHSMEMLLLKEIQSRPQDMSVRVRLLRNYVEKRKLDDAFTYIQKIEHEMNTSGASSDWHNAVWMVLSKIEQIKDTKRDWAFWQITLHTLERLIYLSLGGDDGNTGISLPESSGILFKFDQYLHKFSLNLERRPQETPQNELQNYCLEHYVGQLLLHAATLLIKRELLSNKNKWRDTMRNVLPLLFLGYQINTMGSKSNHWIKHCESSARKLIEQWRLEGAFRRAQLGRTLFGCVQEQQSATVGQENQSDFNLIECSQPTGLWQNSDDILSFVRQICLEKTWRRQLFQTLFTHAEQKLKEQSSMLVHYARLQEPMYTWPSLAEVEANEQQALALRPQSLSHHVYLAMCSEDLVEAPRITFYEGMPEDCKQNLSYCGPDSLSKLDLDTFLYAVVLQSQRKLEVQRANYDSYNVGSRSATAKPHMLPFVNIAAQLATDEQLNWWTLAYKLHTHAALEGNRAEQRTILQYGLEAVRGINGPRADLYIIFRLGQLLAVRAQGVVHAAAPERVSLEARAESLYLQGFNMLKREHMQQFEPLVRYFKYANSNATSVRKLVNSAAEGAISFLSSRYFKVGKYEEFIDEMRGLNLPMATYMQAEAYRILEDCSRTPRVSRSRFLERRQECLQQTQQLLRNDTDHPLSSLITSELMRTYPVGIGSNTRFSLGKNDLDPYGSDPHNNSSAYEDAEDDFYAAAAHQVASVPALNRSKRAPETPVNHELEQSVKQMNKELCVFKEDVGGNMEAMRNDIKILTEKFANLEELLKKCRISRETPTREVDAAAAAAALGLDDLFIIDETLEQQQREQQQHQQQQQQLAAVSQPAPIHAMPPFGPGYFNSPHVTQDRFFTPASATPNAFNSPIPYNQQQQQQIYNYYQYMRPSPATQGLPPNMPPANLFGPRGPNYGMPSIYPPNGGTFIDNYGMPPAAPPILPQQPLLPPVAPVAPATTPTLGVPLGLGDGKTSFFNSSPFAAAVSTPTAAPQTSVQPQPQLPAVKPAVPQQVQPPVPAATSVFNRVLNNQPVEKEPPANVVITNSDPLPKPGLAGSNVVAVQPTLSVTIPSQHIKPSVVPASEPPPTTAPIVPSALPTSGFSFNFGDVGQKATANTNSGTNFFSVFPSQAGTGATNSVTTPFGSSFTNASPPADSTTFSFKNQVAQAVAQKEKEEAETKTTPQNDSTNSDLNKSFCADGSAELDYDPRPDFKGIIPLPDEIDVRTGEEDEEIMFSHRAKLYRHAEKEWKDRGTGLIKILKDKSGSCRILMRRDQTHKICANHKINKEMNLTTPVQDKEAKSFIWVANDFADEELRLEKLLVRFKQADTAAQFKKAFQEASGASDVVDNNKGQTNGEAPLAVTKPFALSKSTAVTFVTSTPAHNNASSGGTVTTTTNAQQADNKEKSTPAEVTSTVSKTLFGGINMKAAVAATTTTSGSNATSIVSTTPTTSTSTTAATSAASSPFANFSFTNMNAKNGASPFGILTFGTTSTMSSFLNTDTVAEQNKSANEVATTQSAEDAEEYEPTAQFTPVIPLPELIEVVTGEEHEVVLFEHRAKLLRFVKESGEWKERGLGNIKLLQDRDNVNQVRLVMRREQIHKLCCNQRLLKNTKFNPAKNSKVALTWAGQDYSEEELSTELLCVRFKNAEICEQFHNAVLKAQAAMSGDDDEPTETQSAASQEQKVKSEAKEAVKPVVNAEPKSFGDAFKPKAGSWQCSGCYTTNDGTQLYCLCCEAPKDSTVPPKQASLQTGGAINLSTSSAGKFTFGFPSGTNNANITTSTEPKPFSFGSTKPAEKTSITNVVSTTNTTKTTTASGGFGDAFKPKVGSWQCDGCYTTNDATKDYCICCEAPKDATVPPKKDNQLLGGTGLQLPATTKFTFGFGAPTTSTSDTASVGSTGTIMNNLSSTSVVTSSIFGAPLTSSKSEGTTTTTATPFGSSSFNFKAPSLPLTSSTPALGSNTFSFSMNKASGTQQPKSPLAADADATNTGDDELHEEVEEEENNAYFAPVIPLPDKVDVVTGEEDEEVLYKHRAKLYRLTDGDWKERGLGDVKILRHRKNKKLRVVMRRDKVLKTCLNHILNSSVTYKAKDDKSWLFVVHDFSEGENVLERFTLRFKNADVAKGFVDAIKSALNGTAQPIADDEDASTNTTEDSLCSANVSISNDLKALADKLKLDYDFFTSETKCPGCRGCDPDKFNYGSVSPTTATNVSALPLVLPALQIPAPPSTTPESRSVLKPAAFSPATTPNAKSFSLFGSAASANSTTVAPGTPTTATTTSAPKTDAVNFSFTNAFNASQEVKTPSSGGFLFEKSVFGRACFGNTTSQQSIFGGNNSTASDSNSTMNIFGGALNKKNEVATTNQTETKNATENSTKSIFGSFNTNVGSGNSLFSGGNIFGGSPNTNASQGNFLFGSAANATPTPTFGSVAAKEQTTITFSDLANKKEVIDDVKENKENNNANVKPTASVPPANSFATLAAKASENNNTGNATQTNTFADLAAKAGDDFATLAAKSTASPNAFQKSSTGGFFGLTHQDAFKSFSSPAFNDSAKNKSLGGNNNDASNTEDATDENYDPHYDPIIALPDEIVVSTGEEHETKLFGERATLYRFDSDLKEWKERGVGELKILKHNDLKTCRMVMRREQIHKLVLNMQIVERFKVDYMNNNKKSFVWAHLNYAESSEGILERLACRFRKQESADSFLEVINSCIPKGSSSDGSTYDV